LRKQVPSSRSVQAARRASWKVCCRPSGRGGRGGGTEQGHGAPSSQRKAKCFSLARNEEVMGACCDQFCQRLPTAAILKIANCSNVINQK
jgi:hypothetical protein